MPKYKSMTRAELADYAGVSRRTFARWLAQEPHRQILQRMGGNKMRILPPAAVRYICETFCIDMSS